MLRAIVAAVLVAVTFAGVVSPARAVADEGGNPSSSSSASASTSAASTSEELTDSESQPVEVVYKDYSNVINEQVAGDFFFVMCVDTALLAMVLGAIGWLCFRRG